MKAAGLSTAIAAPPFLLLFVLVLSPAAALASPAAGAVVKQLSAVVRWSRGAGASKTQQNHEGIAVQFENGYFVETLVEGNKLGMTPHTLRTSAPEGGEFLVVDARGSIMRAALPLSEYSRTRLVAGSFEGNSGHVDGKPSDARFKQPKGVAVDDKGNVYVADTANLAIRKIGENGVTTIAGGKSNAAGYSDGPGEDAKFSSDFDVVYVKKTCSLLVVDRGNAALREIALQQEDCNNQNSMVMSSDIVLVIGAVVAGYLCCLLQQGFGSSSPQKMQTSEDDPQNSTPAKPFYVETLKDEPSAGWPSFGTLLADLVKLVMEGIGNVVLNSFPFSLWRARERTGLTPHVDHLVMPEDTEETPAAVPKFISPPVKPDTFRAPTAAATDSPPKVQKCIKPPKFKDPTLSSKHRSSKRQDYQDMYCSAEAAQIGSKGQKDRTRLRHREKSGEVAYGSSQPELKPAEMRPSEYGDAKYEPYSNIRSKYSGESAFRF